MDNEIIYLPIGVPTFHLESAQKEFEKSVALLKSIDENIKVPDEMLLTVDKLNSFIADKHPVLIIVQNVTFANGEYIAEVLRRFDCHILLWTAGLDLIPSQAHSRRRICSETFRDRSPMFSARPTKTA